MIAVVSSATLLGARGYDVMVEVHVGGGLPSFHMVGLPDESCREARDRVRAALSSTGETWPSKKITVNLAPPRHRKTGSGLDLAIAVGVLVANGVVPTDSVAGLGFVGELGLDGSVRAVPGVAPMVGVMDHVDVVVPAESVVEANVAATGVVRPVRHLRELIEALNGREPWPDVDRPDSLVADEPMPDLSDVRGQPVARHALEVAAAGGHHLLLIGPPGSGKTMLARRLPGLLPPLSRALALEATMVHSASGVALPEGGLIRLAPFRAPHHTSTSVALVGGGSHSLRPGEISLAHGGVLFLDELAEFPRGVLDALREPLEAGEIGVARAHDSAVLPARFQLVAATNPCPCGGGPPGACECEPSARRRYVSRMSGPLLDRFDLRVAVQRPGIDELLDTERAGEPTSEVAGRVGAAQHVAILRQGTLNAALSESELDLFAPLSDSARAVMRAEMERGRLTGRGYHRIRRVARTLCDLSAVPDDVVDAEHVIVALGLRTRLQSLPATSAAVLAS